MKKGKKTNEINRKFSKDRTQMAKKHIKKLSSNK